MKDLQGNERWVGANGKIVIVDGKQYKIRVTSFEAIYPYKRYVISVYADPVDKEDPEYRRIKALLGDDWMTDVLDSLDDAFYASVFGQCFPGEVG